MRVLVSGASGRMSKRIISLMANDKEIEAVFPVERKNHPDIGKDLAEAVGIKADNLSYKITDKIDEVIEQADVVVEFTTPEATLEHLKKAQDYKKAVVIGTTGFSQKELETIKDAASGISVFLSPNMSIGVNVVFSLIEQISKKLPSDYQVEIIETHHKFKKDAPSGTAKKIAEIIARTKGQDPEKVIIYGRKGHTGERKGNEICIHAVRGGSVVGRHKIKFISDEDEIEIIHNAASRDVFARGAVKAVKFIIKKKRGLYSTEDLLK
jgi:4-hydroxy-tetrahydrodipicolinate reductase